MEAPAVLTIEPGTIVRMEQKTTGGTSVTDPADVGTLIICRGAKIVANGTAESPIIFTNIDDPFVPGGEITIPNKDNGVTVNSTYAPYDTGTPANNGYTKRSYTGNDRFNYDSTCGGVIILGRTPVAFGNPGASGNIAIAVGNVGSGYESAPAVTFNPAVDESDQPIVPKAPPPIVALVDDSAIDNFRVPEAPAVRTPVTLTESVAARLIKLVLT